MRIDVSKAYGKQTVFSRLQLSFSDGEIVCILGASGVGKTTLLHILARQIPFEGTLTDVPDSVGYAYQQPRLLPHLSAKENLAYVGADENAANELLSKVGLETQKDKPSSQLSGGEQQRVALCRAFLGKNKLLLLDEPFSSLDVIRKQDLYQAFIALWQEHKPTAVLVTHDIEEAWELAQRVIVLKDGKVALDMRLPDTALPRKIDDGADVKAQILRAMRD